MFATFLDREGYFFDTTHFPKVVEAFPFRGRGVYRIRGKVDEEFGFCSMVVTAMFKLETLGRDDVATPSAMPTLSAMQDF